MRRAALVLLLASAPPAFAADPPRVDLYGDPLPAGAVARLGSTLLLNGTYRDLRFAPDGKTFHAAAAGPAWVQFDVATGKRVKLVPLPGVPLHLPWVSADGSTALVDQPDDVRHVVEVADGKKLLELTAKERIPRGDPFSPDGRHLVAYAQPGGGQPGFVLMVWDTRTGKSTSLGAATNLSGVPRFSPDGTRLLIVNQRGATCLAVGEWKEVWRAAYRDTRNWIKPFFSADGKWIAIEGETPASERTVVVWDAATGTTPDVLKLPPTTHTEPMGFSPDGRELLVQVAGRERRWVWWNLRDGTERPQPGKPGYQWTPSPGATHLLSQGFAQIQIHDAATGKELLPDIRDRRHRWGVTDVAFDPTGTRVLTTGNDGTVRVWNARDGKILRIFTLTTNVPCGEVRFGMAPDGRSGVAQFRQGLNNLFSVLDLDAGRVTDTVPLGTVDINRPSWIGPPQVSADGSVLLPRQQQSPAPTARPGERNMIATADALRWTPASKEVVAVTTSLTPGMVLGVFSADRRLIVAGSRVCDVSTGRELLRLDSPHGRAFGPASLSADGRFVAARVSPVTRVLPPPAPPDWRGVGVWDTLTGKFVAHLDTPGELHLFTPDGRRLVTSDAAGLSVWDVAAGKRLLHHASDPRQRFLEGGHFSTVLAVSPDARLAATGRHDGNALVWDLSAAREVKAAAPSRFDLLAAWAILADPKSERPLTAMWRLVDHPERTVPFLRDRVRELVKTNDNDAAIRAAVADLDDDDFATREAAEKRLVAIGEPSRKVMQEVAAKSQSPEQRNRIARVLNKLDAALVPPLRTEEVALGWALAALERIGTPAARDAIRDIAAGPPTSRVTREARAAIERLKK